ncbi:MULTISPECIES: H-NS family nucleoid-associated regulatory protein [Photorhabdus]|uniref:DNA-binding protein n=1 Tax=Photorhabdus hindustanensis TaxID=2918802 RepID=A0A0A0CL28_9GAMM|nr:MULTISPECIES: H-NS histone family protein [Photorhabdus]KGM26303.1 DNA-binding protein [Photorhabdus luminescens]MBS9430430.1 DNA-binding protein [Photorhabdus akhurstii]PQQ24177.1 DNA-binding protein [Photorhabdus hindustanensis]PQQ30678.1 DNA-binding protein [Photorhabdus luminescens]PQQ34477.1 DNA-binding protein [Photorhabdus luminescens]
MTTLTTEQEYSIISKHLSRISTLRRFAQTKDVEWLEDVYKSLETIMQDNKETFRLMNLEAEQKEQKRLDILRLIKETGFDLETINIPVTISSFKAKKSNAGKGKTRKPKYQFNENGEVKYWSGNGKKPSSLQKLLNEGHSLNEFLIQK